MIEDLIRGHVRSIKPYEPVQPFELISQSLGFCTDEMIKLDANENPYGPLPAVKDALSQLSFPHIYPDSQSILLRQALAEWVELPQEQLVVTAGADELIDLLMRLFLDPGDAILISSPTFGMYAFDAAIHNARVIDVPRRENYSLDLMAIQESVRREKPKLLFMASPNNPDGRLMTDQEYTLLADLPAVLVLDEAYIDFATPRSSKIQDVFNRKNLVVLRTLSKWGGLAGLRVGYGILPSGIMSELLKIKQPYGVSTAAQSAALAALSDQATLKDVGRSIIKERERLFNVLSEVDFIKPMKSQANFILCQILDRDAAELRSILAQRGILVRHFAKPRLEDCIRISIGRPEQNDRLLQVLREME
jgi:histidinol-phosphate aminotransferase